MGLEIPQHVLAQPEELRRGYLQAVKRFNDRFEDICHRNLCERVLVDTSRPLAELFVDYLNQRSMLIRHH